MNLALYIVFAFGRYNGILDQIPTNMRNIEAQLMSRFDRDNQIMNMAYPADNQTEFLPILDKLLHFDAQRGTLNDMMALDFASHLNFASRNTNYIEAKWYNLQSVMLPSKLLAYMLSDTEYRCLNTV